MRAPLPPAPSRRQGISPAAVIMLMLLVASASFAGSALFCWMSASNPAPDMDLILRQG